MAVCVERRTREALAALSEFGRFRTAPFPRVLTGRVADPMAFREHLASEECRLHGGILSRVVPMEETCVFERDDVTETICERLEASAPRLAGKTFFVRTKLRGLKGRLEHPVVERAIGAFLVDRSSAEGGPSARVSFSDPDEVVVVEVVGARAGYAILDRATRASPLVKVR